MRHSRRHRRPCIDNLDFVFARSTAGIRHELWASWMIGIGAASINLCGEAPPTRSSSAVAGLHAANRDHFDWALDGVMALGRDDSLIGGLILGLT